MLRSLTAADSLLGWRNRRPITERGRRLPSGDGRGRPIEDITCLRYNVSQIFCDFEERDVVFLKRLKGFCFSQHSFSSLCSRT